jgi:hypothetical protein
MKCCPKSASALTFACCGAASEEEGPLRRQDLPQLSSFSTFYLHFRAGFVPAELSCALLESRFLVLTGESLPLLMNFPSLTRIICP